MALLPRSHRMVILCALIVCILPLEPHDHASSFVIADEQQTKRTDSKGAKSSSNTPAGSRNLQEHPFPNRIPAPSLDGGSGWLNVKSPLDLRDFRGKFVLLDFWTYCCINCMHILPELKKLEQSYPDEIVVIGIHSAKFDAEKGSDNIRQAILRYDIEHPVINDADHVIWRRYRITGWPALRVIDPQGNIIAAHSGEIDFETMDLFFKNAIPFYKKRGLLNSKPVQFDLERDRAKNLSLKFPGKVLANEDSNRLYISDSGHHRIVITDLKGRWIQTIGSGLVGKENGPFGQASFNSPQGLALDGDKLYVADTQNHLIRLVDLQRGSVSTLAGTGAQNRGDWPGMDQIELSPEGALKKLPMQWSSTARNFPLASPWALLIHQNYLYIAMAGTHQIWRMPLDDEPKLTVYAGNGREDIIDGIRLPKVPPRIEPKGFGADYASFAQPSGLASDEQTLYVADSEGSAIRAIPFDKNEKVDTLVGSANLPRGHSLFSFGDQDGKGSQVRLQHVLGITQHEGLLYVADTYNNKIKKLDIRNKTAITIAGDGHPGNQDLPARFDEPEGLSYAGGKLYVADTNNHALRVIDLENENRVTTLLILGLSPPQTPHPTAKPD